MTNELLINGQDAYAQWGVRMGDGFIDALTTTPSPKQCIRSESRIENGARILPGPTTSSNGTQRRYVASRDITLVFNMHANSRERLYSNRKSFTDTLLQGKITLKVPSLPGDETYRLLWTGTGGPFSTSLDGLNCVMMMKFTEPNPADRTQ